MGELQGGSMHISSRNFGLIGISLILLLALAVPTMAQNRIFQGKVTDDKGQPIVGAQITIQATDSKTRQYTTKTDKKGAWIYMGLAAGEYRVIARANGFAPNAKGPYAATIQAPIVIDLQLVPGSDGKLPFEFSEQEMEQMKKEQEKAEKRKQFSAEVQATFDAGLKLAAEGKYEEAIAEFKKALEKDPEQPNILANMADSYSKMDKNTEALEIYEKAIALRPDDAALYTNKGVILSKIGKNTESQEAFKKAASLNPAASAQNFYNIGATLVNNGKMPEAAESFKQAIAADPNFAEAYYQLGMCLSGKAETMPDAIKALETYIKIGKKLDQIDTSKQIIDYLQKSLKK
jgi:tetratricopeptide (TPR) repeat protein